MQGLVNSGLLGLGLRELEVGERDAVSVYLK